MLYENIYRAVRIDVFMHCGCCCFCRCCLSFAFQGICSVHEKKYYVLLAKRSLYCSEIASWERSHFELRKMTNRSDYDSGFLWTEINCVELKLKCNRLQVYVCLRNLFPNCPRFVVCFLSRAFPLSKNNRKNFNIIKIVKMREAKQKRTVKTATAMIYGQKSIVQMFRVRKEEKD